VFVYRMVTAGTIEERIQALKASKKDLFDKLIGGLGGDFDLSQHFTSLRGLVQLTAQVVPELTPEVVEPAVPAEPVAPVAELAVELAVPDEPVAPEADLGSG
jgi:hypothetical protein